MREAIIKVARFMSDSFRDDGKKWGKDSKDIMQIEEGQPRPTIDREDKINIRAHRG